MTTIAAPPPAKVAPPRPVVTPPAEPRTGQTAPVEAPRVEIDVKALSFYYGNKQALQNISLEISANLVTAFIGPSGCGKSTLLRTLNRMNDAIGGARVEGSVRIAGRDIYAHDSDVVSLRRQVGMVFQKSNPFPKS